MEFSLGNNKQNRAQRLITLRQMAGINRRELSKSSGISFNTLTSWELARAGGLTYKGSELLVEAFKKVGIHTSVTWLLEGIGTPPYNANLADITPRVTASLDLGSLPSINQEMEVFCKVNQNAIVITIIDDSMQPVYEAGEVLGGILAKESEISLLINKVCIVKTMDNKTLCRRLLLGDEPDTYTLKCLNNDSIAGDKFLYNVKLQNVAKIVWHRMSNDIK